MHHFPAGPPRFARIRAARARAAACTRRLFATSPRRAVPLLVIGVVLAVLGVAAPVVSEAVTGRPGVPLDSASATPLRDAGIRMGVDGDGSGASSSAPGQTKGSAGEPAGHTSGSTSTAADTAANGTTTAPAAPETAAADGSTPPAGGTTTTGGTAGSPTGTTGTTSSATEPATGSPGGTPATAPGSATADGSSPAADGSSPAPDGSSPAPASSPEVPAAVPGTTDAVLAALDTARAAAGCAALVPDAGLTDAAQAHAMDMADAGVLGLSGLAGSTAVVAQGPPDAASAVAAWLADATDRSVLLDCTRTSLGAGGATGPAGPWWTVVVA